MNVQAKSAILTNDRVAGGTKGTYTLRPSRNLKLAETPLAAEVLGQKRG